MYVAPAVATAVMSPSAGFVKSSVVVLSTTVKVTPPPPPGSSSRPINPISPVDGFGTRKAAAVFVSALAVLKTMTLEQSHFCYLHVKAWKKKSQLTPQLIFGLMWWSAYAGVVVRLFVRPPQSEAVVYFENGFYRNHSILQEPSHWSAI